MLAVHMLVMIMIGVIVIIEPLIQIYNYCYIIKYYWKKVENINLPISYDQYTTILDWKKQNNLIKFSPLTKESNYEWKVENDNYNLTQTFETKDTIYHINCFSDYQEKLTQWKNNCYIKPGVYYSHDTIRDKFGYYSQTVYDEKNKKLWYKLY